MRLIWMWALLGLLSAAPLQAQKKPNTLTQKEITDGWLLLFDGETLYGWLPPGDPVKWSAEYGTIQATGEWAGKLATTTVFGDFEMKGEAWSDGDKRWRNFTVRRTGTRVDIRAPKDKPYGILFEDTPQSAVVLEHKGKQTVRFRGLKLRPLGLKSIFNGKDLSGWKEVPGHASVYTVTPEGWLNVKNGNGDLQTEGKWGDFVLQLDVYSNGDHLNSGVFFRANPGLFWSGYEDQIRNQWDGDNRLKAVDYGTGGIYNRLPARKVVSSDREWFKMTLVAHGLHFASWVNGYMVADFTDTRPANEANARQGARTTAGVLSLQGHDPTTDLSFRNIRIVELGK